MKEARAMNVGGDRRQTTSGDCTTQNKWTSGQLDVFFTWNATRATKGIDVTSSSNGSRANTLLHGNDHPPVARRKVQQPVSQPGK